VNETFTLWLLILAAGLFLGQAFGGARKVSLGWLGLFIWGVLAAIGAANS
jgi:hypothetical protein